MVVGAGPLPARWPHRATFGVKTTRTLPLPEHRAGTGPAPTFCIGLTQGLPLL